MYYTLISKRNDLPQIFSINKTKKTADGVELHGDEEDLGYLAEDTVSLISGSVPVSQFQGDSMKGNAFVMLRRRGLEYTFYMVDLFPEKYEKKIEKKQEKKFEEGPYPVFGTQTTYHGLRDIKEALTQGDSKPVKVSLTFENGKLVVVDDMGRTSGFIPEDIPLPEIFTEKLTAPAIAQMPSSQEIHDFKSKKDRGRTVYEVRIVPEEMEEKTNSSMLEDRILELNKRCIDHPENVLEKIAFMQSSGLSDSLIDKILGSYICYRGEDRFKIKKPDYPYMDSADKNLQRCIAYLLTGSNVRLVGDKGCGKNTMLNTISWLMNQPLFKIGCSERTDEYAVFGSTQVKNGDTVHKLSPFAHGLVIGGLCVLDEGNMVPPELMSVVNQLADDTREVDINNYGLLRLHDRTRILMTMNEDYQGTVELNDATADRFQGLYMQSNMNLKNLLKYLVPTAKDEDLVICENVHKKILSAVREGTVSSSAITIRGYQAALKAADLISLSTALKDSVMGRCQNPEERQVIKTSIDMFCASKK